MCVCVCVFEAEEQIHPFFADASFRLAPASFLAKPPPFRSLHIRPTDHCRRRRQRSHGEKERECG